MLPALMVLCVVGGARSATDTTNRTNEASATNAPAFYKSWNAALEAASGDRALMLVVFHASWCGPCKMLEKQTLASQEFLQKGGPLHVVEVDVDREKRRAREMGVSSIPDLVLMTDDGKIVSRRKGFVTADVLLKWIEEGRRRAAQGVWEGMAWGEKAVEFMPSLSSGIQSNAEPRLLEMMGSPDPSLRSQVIVALVAQHDKAMPFLLTAITNEYLGVRVCAEEILAKLAPHTPPVDAWAAPAERQQATAALKKWWDKEAHLPLAKLAEAVDPTAKATAARALDMLAANDPLERTRGMTVLVGIGTGALPSVREALKRAERNGDARVAALLEDVRWTILVAEDVEAKVRGARRSLARGNSAERQAVASKLSRAGESALPALTELVGDADPLVKEAALGALAVAGKEQGLGAMASLLKASDANLRMTAAQSLGKTKKQEAARYLVTVLDDPNEVVACAAIAALEEVKAKGEGKALIACLADTRWRVRAAAAETLGKLGVRDAEAALKKLLADRDGFVVKTAIEALKKLGAAPDPAELKALAQRLPGLKRLVVETLAESGKEAAFQTLTGLFQPANDRERLDMLQALSSEGRGGSRSMTVFSSSDFGEIAKSDEERAAPENPWKPLLTTAFASPNARVRQEAVRVMTLRALPVAAEFLQKLLADPDTGVRQEATRVVVGVAAFHWSMGREEKTLNHGILVWLNSTNATATVTNALPAASTDDVAKQKAAAERRQKKLARARGVAKQHAEWHALLGRHAGATPTLPEAVALFVTSEGAADLPVLEKAVRAVKPAELAKETALATAMPLVLKRLPWPAGQSLVEQMAAVPSWLALLVQSLPDAAPAVRDFVLAPERLVKWMEATCGKKEIEEKMLEAVLRGSHGEGKALAEQNAQQTEPVFRRMLQSANPLLRAAAVAALDKGNNAAPVLVDALRDTNAWVRGAAAQAVAHGEKDQAKRQVWLAPLLGDADSNVVLAAAMGLLERDVAKSASVVSSYFQFEKHRVWLQSISYSSSSEQRPLEVVAERPAWLEQVRALAKKSGQPGVMMLLLGQHGDFSALDDWWTQRRPAAAGEDDEERSDSGTTRILLTLVELSHDAKYLPLMREVAAAAKDRYRLQPVLQAVRGMSGREARQLRLEINRRLAEMAD